jgi:hypothetical protein
MLGGTMKVFRLFLSAACVTLLLASSACKSTHEEIRQNASAPRPKLRSDSLIYVALPAAAKFKNDFVPNSNTATANILRDTFSKYVKRAYSGRRTESFEEALETARRNACTYLIFPTILRWEDHSTEFSGIRDKLELKIDLADAVSGDILDSTVLKAEGKWMSDGGDTPQDLLPAPVANYVDSLFQGPIAVPSALETR